VPYHRLLARTIALVVVALSLTANSPLFAQAVSEVSHRLEISGELGLTGVHPYIGYSDARTPPFYEPLDQSSGTFLTGVGFRVLETPKTSTAIRVQWGKVSDVTVTTSGATSDYRGITYTLDRTLDTSTLTLLVSQSFDLRSHSAARPWVGAGFALSRLSADQQSTQSGVSDPTYHYSATESFSLTSVGVTFGGGVRLYPANHLLVGTEAGIVMLFGDAKGTSRRSGSLSTSFESELRLFAVLQVGLAF
jgi:opacity protein-like surface antigen